MAEQVNEAGTLSDWAVAVAVASAIPSGVVLVGDARITFPDFRGIDEHGRAILAVPPSYDQPDQLQTVHEAGHALQAVAPLDALATYWSIRRLPGDPEDWYRRARAIELLDDGRSPWGYRPHERFAETFAVVFHPIPATERMLPTDWTIPPLDEARRGRLRAFFSSLPRREGAFYLPIDMYDPTIGADSIPPVPPAPPSPDGPADDLGNRITAFWQRIGETPDGPLTHAEFTEWAMNYQRYVDLYLA